MRHFNRTHQGFTLIEIMVALAVLSITMTSSYTLYQSLTEQTATQVKNIDALRNLRSLQQKISYEVRKTGYLVSAATVIPDAAATTSGVQALVLEAPGGSYGVAATNTDPVNTEVTLVAVPVVTTTFSENSTQLTLLSAIFSDNGSLTYDLLPQQDHWVFGVSGNYLVAKAVLDYENSLDLGADYIYDIRVRATDSQGHSQETDLSITVTNLTPENARTTGTSTLVNVQSTSGLVITKGSTGIRANETTHFKISGMADDVHLFLADGTTAVADGDLITTVEASAGLKITPTVDP